MSEFQKIINSTPGQFVIGGLTVSGIGYFGNIVSNPALAALIAYYAATIFFPIVAAILAIILIFAIPYFINQSVAFNNRMSSYKNIQFRFKGSYGQAFMVIYVWPILGMLTLGILYPLALLKANEYFVRNSSYGTSHFKFNAT